MSRLRRGRSACFSARLRGRLWPATPSFAFLVAAAAPHSSPPYGRLRPLRSSRALPRPPVVVAAVPPSAGPLGWGVWGAAMHPPTRPTPCLAAVPPRERPRAIVGRSRPRSMRPWQGSALPRRSFLPCPRISPVWGVEPQPCAGPKKIAPATTVAAFGRALPSASRPPRAFLLAYGICGLAATDCLVPSPPAPSPWAGVRPRSSHAAGGERRHRCRPSPPAAGDPRPRVRAFLLAQGLCAYRPRVFCPLSVLPRAVARSPYGAVDVSRCSRHTPAP